MGRSGGEDRRTGREARGEESCGEAERRDGDGRMDDSPALKPPTAPCPSSALTPSVRGGADSSVAEGNSGRKSYFSLDSKLVKVEYGGAAGGDGGHGGSRMNAKANTQCVTKTTVSGGDYPHANPNIPHAPPPPLPPPPALKPLELGGPNLPVEAKAERDKLEKAEKLMDKTPSTPPSLLPQTSPLPQPQPSPHPHHYSPTSWQGVTATGCQGSWGYARYPGNHHPHQPQHQPPVQQQQLRSEEHTSELQSR